MTSVGPVVALTYRVTVDVPARFRNSKAVWDGYPRASDLIRVSAPKAIWAT